MQIQRASHVHIISNTRILNSHISRTHKFLIEGREGLMNELHALMIPAEKFCFFLTPLFRKVRAQGQPQKKTPWEVTGLLYKRTLYKEGLESGSPPTYLAWPRVHALNDGLSNHKTISNHLQALKRGIKPKILSAGTSNWKRVTKALAKCRAANMLYLSIGDWF